ncbi:glycosyltransferase [Glycocaulis sp.]
MDDFSGSAWRTGSRRAAVAAHRAAFDLLIRNPGASAGSSGGVPAALWLGPLSFLAVLAVFDGRLAALTASILAGLVFLVLAGFRLAAACQPASPAPRKSLRRDALPTITVIAALHREAGSVAALIEALSRFDYPADRYEIALAIEADDHATLAAAYAAARPATPPLRIIPVPAIGPRTKPKALNYALALTDSALVAVYDAEDEPHPGQLRAAAEAFAANPRLGCVQAPLGWYNRTECWLTHMFALEYAAQFHVILPFFARLGWPLPLGGTSNVFARAALSDCGAWDPYNVTEDADLGFRLARHGWQAGIIAPGTLEEAPVRLKAWTAQRSRWLKGHAISWAVQMREPGALRREAGLGGFAALQASLGANALSATVHAPALVLIAGLLIASMVSATPPLVLIPALAGYGAAMLVAWTGARRAGFSPRLRDLMALPAYWLLQFPAMIRALREIAGAPYFWAKTDHAVTARARTAPDEPYADAHPYGGHGAGLRLVRVAQRQAV